MKTQWCVVAFLCDDPDEGHEVIVGPFVSRDDAKEWRDKHLGEHEIGKVKILFQAEDFIRPA